MATYLVTGANRGLGLEFVRQLSARGERVIAACRAPAEARDLAQLASDRVTVHALDVADGASVAALRRAVGDAPVDVLINNAGVMGPEEQAFGATDYDAWVETLRVNTLGPLRVLEAFASNLERGQRKLAVTITSGMGSIGDNGSGGYYAYRSSKAAVNMVMKSAAVDLRARGISVVVMNPGWVQTDMGGPSATITPKESIAAMLGVLDRVTPRDSGKFLNYRGGEFVW